MSEQCATCGAADVLLFTCGDCGRAFCADHGLPNHSCEEFAPEEADETAFEWGADGRADPTDVFTESGFRPADDAPDAAERPEPRSVRESTAAAVTRAPREAEGETAPAVEQRPHPVDGNETPAVRPRPRRPDGSARPAVRRAPEPDPTPAADSAAAATDGPTTASGPGGDPTPTTADGGHAGGDEVPFRAMDGRRPPGRVERSDPRTLTEWLDQQTYLSLSVKTAALATVVNGALYFGMFLTLYGLLPV